MEIPIFVLFLLIRTVSPERGDNWPRASAGTTESAGCLLAAPRRFECACAQAQRCLPTLRTKISPAAPKTLLTLWGSFQSPLLNSTNDAAANPTSPLILANEHCLPPCSNLHGPRFVRFHAKIIRSLSLSFGTLLTMSSFPFCTLPQEAFSDFLLATLALLLSPSPQPPVGSWLGQAELRKLSNKKAGL